MTCKERLKKMHPEWTDAQIDDVVNQQCPHVHWGIPITVPEKCRPFDTCVECWNREIPEAEPTETVNHPKHYGREGAMECIDEMILVFGVEATMNFCLLNAWKYRYRAADKNGIEDLKKSDWYMKLYKDLGEKYEC